ncbi:uncharacterized protein DS421_7g223070 [Arachis hypogaea]|nr:uncharacterized protein DS421_7g223070 [Arachis hypogaea]
MDHLATPIPIEIKHLIRSIISPRQTGTSRVGDGGQLQQKSTMLEKGTDKYYELMDI